MRMSLSSRTESGFLFVFITHFARFHFCCCNNSAMLRRCYKPGILAIVKCKTRALHPVTLKKEKLEIPFNTVAAEDKKPCHCAKEKITINRPNQECYVLYHPDFINNKINIIGNKSESGQYHYCTTLEYLASYSSRPG